MKTNLNTRRPAFTLIELLVVIAIIGVLVSLTAVGVMTFLVKGPDTQNAAEISQLQTAVQMFKTKFKVWPPSKIKLCGKRSQYDLTQQIDKESLAYLNQFWPRIGDSNSPFM